MARIKLSHSDKAKKKTARKSMDTAVVGKKKSAKVGEGSWPPSDGSPSQKKAVARRHKWAAAASDPRKLRVSGGTVRRLGFKAGVMSMSRNGCYGQANKIIQDVVDRTAFSVAALLSYKRRRTVTRNDVRAALMNVTGRDVYG